MSDAAVLSAQAAIRDVLVNYCRGMDRIDVPLTKATWHPGGRAYYEGAGGARDCTGDVFCDWAADFHRRHLSTAHAIENCLIVVKGDRAVSETMSRPTFCAPKGSATCCLPFMGAISTSGHAGMDVRRSTIVIM
jgi:hypothetical protein